jgi:hypothetical protein
MCPSGLFEEDNKHGGYFRSKVKCQRFGNNSKFMASIKKIDLEMGLPKTKSS